MSSKVAGRVAVITGASSGIGRAAAMLLARRGADVALVGRDAGRLEAARAEAASLGARAAAYECDVADADAVLRTASSAASELGGASFLVNNAGFGVYGTVAEAETSEIGAQMETNYMGMVHCTKAFLPQLLRARGAHIVNVASVAASIGLPGMAAYCASKFAMLGFSEALRHELAASRVGVTVVSPIAVRTRFFDGPSFARARRYSPVSLSAERVAGAVYRAIGSRRGEIVVPAAARVAIWLKHTVPFVINPAVARAFGASRGR